MVRPNCSTDSARKPISSILLPMKAPFLASLVSSNLSSFLSSEVARATRLRSSREDPANRV